MATGFEQTPLAGLQTPATWQASSAVHVTVETGAPQAPALQVSPVVHCELSLQVVPVWGEHVPRRATEALQDWQSVADPPPHAVLQQNPSTQKLLPLPSTSHWRHPATRQSEAGHAAPKTLC